MLSVMKSNKKFYRSNTLLANYSSKKETSNFAQALFYHISRALGLQNKNNSVLLILTLSFIWLQFFVTGCDKNSNSRVRSSEESDAAGTANLAVSQAGKPAPVSPVGIYDNKLKITNNSHENAASRVEALKKEDTTDSVNNPEIQEPEIVENKFVNTNTEAVSTFAADVDAASYSLCRRAINEGYAPPKNSVRIEELINYFGYDYPQPTDNKPFSITTEVSRCPWKSEHYIAMIGLQGKKIDISKTPPSNVVFLIDVSGSMQDDDKLPLLKESLKMLTNQLREQDKVSIVVYAGAAGVVLPPTSGANKQKIISSLEQLESGGSTNGAEGIELAYKIAKENYFANGNNRVILATDGDFNVGPSSEEELVKLIENKRSEGIFLTVLGFGSGNFQDSKMEQLADKGNGNYAYVDSKNEANKAMVQEFGATLTTIAKDVKIQVAFNPTLVKEYRLIGYENRVLNNEDFDDDKKDAGEIGAGHSVTALYEIIPTNRIVTGDLPRLDDFSKNNISENNFNANEMFKVKFRYKNPNEDKSNLILGPGFLTNDKINQPSTNLQFAASVAEWGLILKGSQYKGRANIEQIIQNATNALTTGFQDADQYGYRKEFIELVRKSKNLH